ncbi:MAG: Cytosine/purine/uracil/thiamine/allantoin permease family protein, partial [Phycisphaerales bacterium]|nr:Cytosine/purine/uracil/thiamine/allantoin permease family protein [Phycisphaerales bacterium]
TTLATESPAAHAWEGLPEDVTQSRLYNQDLAPTTAADRKWSVWSVAALWVSMCACIPTYLQASGLYATGFNWWQTVLTIFLANLIVLIPMVLNAHAGTKYGIPFPVYARASFGVRGANVPAMLRALVGCGWFGIQCWIGGAALFAIACIFKPEWAKYSHVVFHGYDLGITAPQFGAFMAFWVLNIIVIYSGINSIRWLLIIKAPLLIVVGLALVGWAYFRAGGFGSLFHAPNIFAPGGEKAGQFWKFFAPALTANVGFWATVSLNIPDFSRYAKSQRDQVIGQSVALPTTMALFAFIAVAVSSATVVIFGDAWTKDLWDPVNLVATFKNPWALGLSMGAIALATLATNIAANVVSPANDFANLAPRFIGFRLGGVITGLIGIVIMPWKLVADPNGYIFTWLIGYSALLGAVGGVLICDYWLLRRTRFSVADLFRREGRYAYDRGINWSAMLAGAVAISLCVPGFLDHVSGGHLLLSDNRIADVLRLAYDYSVFVTFAVAFALYAVFMAGHPNVRLAVETPLVVHVPEAEFDAAIPVEAVPQI